MLKPYSFLLYFLAIICSFFIGISYAGYIEAGKGQMLAGGAIVLGYGVMGSGIGLLIALYVAYKTNRKFIFNTNILLALSIVVFYGYYHLKYLEKQKAKELEQKEIEQPKKTTTPVNTKDTAMLFPSETTETQISLGMFTPDFNENKPLYFYGNITLEKSLQEHMPIDSITFKQREYGGFDIATAPPWLVPEHLKLDYDMLYFKVKSVSRDFIEVVVNATNNQTSFVDIYAGKLLYWPEFLLSVHSVEFLEPSRQKVYARPFDAAGTIATPYSFFRPIKIENEWMYVELQDNGFKEVAKGWIRWQKDGKLLITYSLLS